MARLTLLAGLAAGLITTSVYGYQTREADETRRYILIEDNTLDFIPSGVFCSGDGTEGIAHEIRYLKDVHSGKSCIRTACSLDARRYVGLVMLLDAKWEPKRSVNIETKLGGNRGDPTVVRFYARSPEQASVTFSFGTGKNKRPILKKKEKEKWITLGTRWMRYEIDVTGSDLSDVKRALRWKVNREHNPGKKQVVIYLDTVYVARLKTDGSPDGQDEQE